MIDKANVPRIAANEDDANSTFALSVKTESQEWTNVNTTNMYSANGGILSGDKEYRTDNPKKSRDNVDREKESGFFGQSVGEVSTSNCCGSLPASMDVEQLLCKLKWKTVFVI